MPDDDILRLMGMGPGGEFRVTVNADIGAIVLEIRHEDGRVLQASMNRQEAETLARALTASVRRLGREAMD
jgi:hypothetical protein